MYGLKDLHLPSLPWPGYELVHDDNDFIMRPFQVEPALIVTQYNLGGFSSEPPDGGGGGSKVPGL